jgi:hypothetical protein
MRRPDASKSELDAPDHHVVDHLAGGPAASVALQEQPVLLHKAIDPFHVDRVLAGGSPLALEERGDPPVAIGWPLVDEATDIGGQFDIAGPDLWQRPQLPHR